MGNNQHSPHQLLTYADPHLVIHKLFPYLFTSGFEEKITSSCGAPQEKSHGIHFDLHEIGEIMSEL